ncbi:hypothetical protein TIFTF001_043083 [Ficus carica]|uniref:Uncharacterized protein n=1 Tax=Ficus carica TaxID=3494 RepID=A0AA88CL26_FICCA|nr:hypothetical protein TIFTF001_043079 [Ficus carica]GMN20412.1 hypothetical protein TIFTF001_043083 [Ficus carica]
MTGHRPELNVPDQDPPALAGIYYVVLGPQVYDRAPTRIGRARPEPTCPCRHLTPMVLGPQVL